MLVKRRLPTAFFFAPLSILFPGLRKILSSLIPVDDIPEGGNIVCSFILIIKIIGMFPDIQC
jgi:hypothetical protein